MDLGYSKYPGTYGAMEENTLIVDEWTQLMNQALVIVVGFTAIVTAAYILIELVPLIQAWRKKQ